MKDLYNIINKYQTKKEELEIIKNDIIRQYKEFDKHMKPQKEYLEKKTKSFDNYTNINSEYIKLGELLTGIALMVGVDKEDLICTIKTDFSILNNITKEELINYFSWQSIFTYISISTKDKRFKYDFKYPINLLDEQYDNKKMIDHCSLRIAPTKSYKDGFSTVLCVDKNIEDIIVKFDLETLSSKKDNQDIINNILNVSYKEKQKKLGGIK